MSDPMLAVIATQALAHIGLQHIQMVLGVD